MAVLATAIGSVILLLAVGVAARRIGLLCRDDAEPLNKVIIYLALPALVFSGVYKQQLSWRLLAITAVGWATILGGLALAYAVGRLLKLPGPTMGAFLLVAALGNTGYLGYPLTIALFGQGQLVKAFFYDIFATSIALMTVGVAVAAHYGAAQRTPGTGSVAWGGRLKSNVALPALAAVVLAILAKPFVLPGFLTQAITHLGDATVPLVMLTIGMSLEIKGFRDRPAALAAAGLLKLVVAPAIALGLWMLAIGALGGPRPGAAVTGIVALEASMPSMMLTYVIGTRYRLNSEFIAAAIALTTMACLVTVPIWQLALRAIA